MYSEHILCHILVICSVFVDALSKQVLPVKSQDILAAIQMKLSLSSSSVWELTNLEFGYDLKPQILHRCNNLLYAEAFLIKRVARQASWSAEGSESQNFCAINGLSPSQNNEASAAQLISLPHLTSTLVFDTGLLPFATCWASACMKHETGTEQIVVNRRAYFLQLGVWWPGLKEWLQSQQ